jgi:hypothetical protein
MSDSSSRSPLALKKRDIQAALDRGLKGLVEADFGGTTGVQGVEIALSSVLLMMSDRDTVDGRENSGFIVFKRDPPRSKKSN